jgi:hypothetical protein
MGSPATIIMSVADVQGAVLLGPITPAAALTLGARLANAVSDGAFSPAGVRVDRDGEVHQGPAPLPPHYQRDHEPQGPAAVWALGLYLLELSLGRTVDEDDVLVRGDLNALVDEAGRPLAPRLADVLSAMLAPDPAARLQGFLPVRRVCAEAAAAFGGPTAGKRGLKDAAVEAMRVPLKATKDLPARAILGSADVQRLQASSAAFLPLRVTPLPGAVLAEPRLSPWPGVKDVAVVVKDNAAPAAEAAPAVEAADAGVAADATTSAANAADNVVPDVAADSGVTSDDTTDGSANDDSVKDDGEDDLIAAAGLKPRRRNVPLIAAVVVITFVVVVVILAKAIG